MSPARRHLLRVSGAIAAAQAADAAAPARTGAAATEYELLRAQLGNDLRRLSEIQSTEGKIERKHELAPQYDAWVAGVLDANAGGQDDIVGWQLIWRIDIGAFDAALPLARYIIGHDLTLPERFDRTAPTLVCEEIAEAALKRLGQGPDAEKASDAEIAEERGYIRDLIRTLGEVDELVAEQDIFDQVRAKHEKAQGLALIRLVELTPDDADGPAGARRAAQESAARHLRRALELDGSSGVKRKLELLDRSMRQQEA